MKLSTRELKILSEIEPRRVRRRRDAWIYLIAAFLLVGITNNVEMFSSLGDESILYVGIAVAAMYLAHTYFAVRPEDKMLDLLQRYVNQDPEALAQLAESAVPDKADEEKGASPTV